MYVRTQLFSVLLKQNFQYSFNSVFINANSFSANRKIQRMSEFIKIVGTVCVFENGGGEMSRTVIRMKLK